MKRLIFFKILTIFIIASFSFFKSFADNAKSKDFVLVKEYLKNLNTLEADFLQISSDGNINSSYMR